MIDTTNFVPGVDDRERRGRWRRDARNALDQTALHFEFLARHDEPSARPAWARAAEMLRDVEAHAVPREGATFTPPAPRGPPRLVVVRA